MELSKSIKSSRNYEYLKFDVLVQGRETRDLEPDVNLKIVKLVLLFEESERTDVSAMLPSSRCK